MSTKQLATFMCDGVASKIGTPELMAFLAVLRDDWKMSTKQLATFMCNGVAGKIGTPELDKGTLTLLVHRRPPLAQVPRLLLPPAPLLAWSHQ